MFKSWKKLIHLTNVLEKFPDAQLDYCINDLFFSKRKTKYSAAKIDTESFMNELLIH